MKGEDLYAWAQTAKKGDVVTIEVGDEDIPYLTGTVESVVDTSDGREITMKEDEFERPLRLTEGNLAVYIDWESCNDDE